MPPIEKLLQHDLTHLGERIVLALVIVALTFGGARLVTRLFERLRQRLPQASASVYITEKLISYALIVAGCLVGLSVSGIDITSLAVFAGATGVGVGLGLQGVVKEFVSGLVIMFDPNLAVGDFVEIDKNLRGEIMEIGPRATRVRTNDGLSIIIPNSDFVENQVINWTYNSGTRRIHIPFSVVPGADKATIRDIVLKAANALPFTSPDTEEHRTQVWLTDFDDDAFRFELVVWPTASAVRHPSSLKAAYYWAIDDALRSKGMEAPNPQNDLNIRSLFGLTGSEALATLGLKAVKPRHSRRVAVSPNDAAHDLATELPPEAPRQRPQS